MRYSVIKCESMPFKEFDFVNKKSKLNFETKNIIRFLESVLEIIVLSVIYYFFWRYAYPDTDFPAFLGNGKFLLMAVYAILSWLFIGNSEGFQIGNLRKTNLVAAQWIGIAITDVITYFQLCLIANKMISPLPMIVLFVVDLFVSTMFIFIYDKLFYYFYAPHNMLMIYGSDNAVDMKIKLDSQKKRYNITKLISSDVGFENICKEIDNFESVIVNDISPRLRNDIMKYCYENDIRMYMVPKITDLLVRGAINITAVDTPMLLVKNIALTADQRFFKRLLDIVLSSIAYIVALPFMLIIMIAIKIEDGGPVFYKQTRVTENGKEFDILKFRSMIVDAEKNGAMAATGKDPRITKVGNIIRPIRFDELPQILNILKGDMSIVGPRPERKEYMEEYSKDIPEFKYRTKVKGGLTGYAQIYGKYNTSAYDKLRLDLMYIQNYSLLLDIKLILLTIRILFSKDSTEGFDEARKKELLREELLKQIQEETENKE